MASALSFLSRTPALLALASCLLRSHSHSSLFRSLWHSCLLYSQSFHFLRLLAWHSHSQSLCYLGLSTCILGRCTSLGFVLHTHSLGGFAPSSFAICAHIIGRFAPSGFVLCIRILGCFALSSFVLCTHILSRFVTLCFMLCTRILGSFTPPGFVLWKDKSVLIASLPRTWRLHFARFAHVCFGLCAHKTFKHHLHSKVYNIYQNIFFIFLCLGHSVGNIFVPILGRFAPNLIIFEPLLSVLYHIFSKTNTWALSPFLCL